MAEDDARELTRAVNNLTRVVANLDELMRRDYPKRAEIERRFVSKQSSRRSMVQGLILLLLICGLGAYVTIEEQRTQRCFAAQFQRLSETYGYRSGLIERETAQNKAIWDIFAEAAGLLRDDPTRPLPQAAQDRLNRELVSQLLRYKREITKIEEERKKAPPPAFPEGTC